MIKSEYDDGKKHVHVLSYGGGTQSTALLLLALEGKINGIIPDYIIFSDTGWEPKHVYEWVQKVNEYIKEKYDREIIFTNGGNIREDAINGVKNEKRFASMPFFTTNAENEKVVIRRQCTLEYKIQPVNRKIRELLGYKPRQWVKEVVHIWKGISLDEIQRVKPIQSRWLTAEHPLVDVLWKDRSYCIKYVEDLGLGTPPQSSCIGCPFHNNELWLDIKKNDPEGWKEAVEFDEAIRNIPKMRNQTFVHKSCTPLAEVDLNENQITLDDFINECEGMCGL
ncbi:hypothetical protein BTGOE4_10140 [Bacillus thuringiensis]|uniref:Phosphoadenosine phosphosulphate reductase domain-containing protein n=1 Tax=Bacillus thuringiensis TaxID=1428 RepID=A0A9X5N9U4_BACTU|nr:phosphoadenosine phosphosulfate reductase family protein [Bacillus thuringiensis]OFC94624.1 hypothetical protein BTGOE4_10140 [Bacillus thuringiensis]